MTSVSNGRKNSHPLGDKSSAIADTVDDLYAKLFGGDQKNRDVDLALTDAIRVPETVFESLPPLLGEIVNEFEKDHPREVVLMSSLAALSACLPNVRGRYGNRWYGSQLLLALIAPAGTGKGDARYGRHLISVVDQRLHDLSLAEWKADKLLGGEDSEPQIEARLCIPADSSAAGFVEFMNRAEWPVLMMESELDTIVALLGNEWGQILHLLRKCAEHEPFSVQRKASSLHVERPELAMLLAGTPGQFLRLVPSAEDGFFSRVAWFYLPSVDEWISPRPNDKESFPEQTIGRKAKEVDALHRALLGREGSLEVKLKPEHWSRVDDLYAALKERVTERSYSNSLHSVIHRSGVIAFRSAMTLTVVRQATKFLGEGAQPNVVTATDNDLEGGLALALIFLDHATRLHGRLPAGNTYSDYQNDGARRFYHLLPEAFARSKAVAIGEETGVAERTVDKYLALYRDSGKLLRPKRGRYAKPGHEDELASD